MEKLDLELDYGPTETDDWLRCPTFRRFRKEWEPRAEEWSPARLMGIAMGAALNHYLKTGGVALPLTEKTPTETGLETIKQGFIEQDKFTLDGLNTLFERCFKKAVKTTVQEILDREVVIDTELSIGKGRIDLVTRSKDDNSIIITDHKAALQLKPEWIPARLVEVETDWQLRDYAWRASQYYGEPVEWIRRHLIVYSPTSKSFLQLFHLQPAALEQWERSARDWFWYRMKVEEIIAFDKLPQNLRECVGRYGKCPAFAACHDLFRDEKAMESIYKRKERRNVATEN